MTRFAKEVRQDVVVGRVSVSRRTAMNVIIGTAAMSIIATPVSAGELPRTAQLEQLIRAFSCGCHRHRGRARFAAGGSSSPATLTAGFPNGRPPS